MPPNDQRLQLSAKAQESLGLIPGTQFYSPFPFAGMNTQASSIAIDDPEFRYIENFIRVGDGKLRTIWDAGLPIYTAPSGITIIYFFFYNIGSVQYCAIFLSDGTAIEIDLATGTKTPFGLAGQFYVPSGGPPVCSQWGIIWLLIANRNTVNDYWIWQPANANRTGILFQPGTFAPGDIPILATGLNYTTLPTVTPYGGNGSGAVVVPTINAGGVVELAITNPGTGYLPGDIVQLAFSGGGSDNSAILESGLNAGGSGAQIIALTNGHGTWDGGAPPSNVQILSGGSGYGTGTSVVANYTLPPAQLGAEPNGHGLWDGGSTPTNVTILAGGGGYTTAPAITANYLLSGVPTQLVATSVTLTSGSITAVTFPATAEGSKPPASGVTFAISPPGGGPQQLAATTVTISGGVITNVIFPATPGAAKPAIGTVSIVITPGAGPGQVTSVNITNPGSGYTTATVAFSGGGGSGAAGTVNLGTGVTSVAMTNNGTGYTIAPISFTGGGGSGAAATATIVGGLVTAITVTAPGTGYASAPTVVIGGNGSSAAATATIAGGIVTGITMTSGGTGYTTAPTVAISGDGSLATGLAVISASGVTGVTVVNGGTGFIYAPTIAFVGGAGSGATGTVVLTGTSIASVNVVNGGVGYQKVPSVVFNGGNGTGAAATAVIDGGQVVQINITAAGSGYTANPEILINAQSGDTGSGATAYAVFTPTSIASVLMSNFGTGYTSAPAVIITPGANNAAYASVVPLMPFGISGDSMETFQSRVWIANPAPGQFSTLPPGGNFAVSAPDSVSDFATSAGGVFFTNTDNFLQTKYVNIRQSNGYLYFFGDGSVSVVSNVQSQGNATATAVVTTFNYQNVDPQIGLQWRDTRLDFSRTILAANPTGIYGLYGGALTKISGKMDDIFLNAVFPPDNRAIVPTGASATIFDVMHSLTLMTIKDPDTGLLRNVMVTWNEKEWMVETQTPALIRIGTQKIASKFFAWGTDGASLYPLFNQPSATLAKRLDTKQYGADSMWCIKNFHTFYIQASDLSANNAGVSFETGLSIGGMQAQLVNPRTDLSSVPSEELAGAGLLSPPVFGAGTPTAYFPVFAVGTGGVPFVTCGLQITSTSPDFVLGNLAIAYTRDTAIG